MGYTSKENCTVGEGLAKTHGIESPTTRRTYRKYKFRVMTRDITVRHEQTITMFSARSVSVCTRRVSTTTLHESLPKFSNFQPLFRRPIFSKIEESFEKRPRTAVRKSVAGRCSPIIDVR